MAIVRTAIRNLLVPGIRTVFWDYASYPSQYKEIYKTYDSKMAEEKDIEMRMFGLAQFKSEAGPIAFDNGFGQRSLTTYVHKNVGLSFAISKNAIEDNLYMGKFDQMTAALKQSMADTKDILGAAPINGGFTTFRTGDGEFLFSTAHPIDGGTYANMPATPSDLNEASVEEAINTIRRLKNAAGNTIQVKPWKLVVPPEGEFAAVRLLNSAYRIGTMNNDISAVNHLSSIPKGYVINQYLTNPSFWMILTDAPNGFKHFVRNKIEVDVDTDFSTKNVLCSAEERYSFGISDPRAVYGNAGA
jgi:phage major head subunit gpT-like protein